MSIIRSDGFALPLVGSGEKKKREKHPIIIFWENFYRDVFGRKRDLSQVSISRKPIIGDWTFQIMIDLALEQMYQQCQEMFPCYRPSIFKDLDKRFPYHERTAGKAPYGIWVRNSLEPHRELSGLSAIQLRQQGIPTETLPESIIHRMRVYVQNGMHLDKRLVTLCAGTRSHIGNAPLIYHDGGEMRLSFATDFYPEQNKNPKPDEGCKYDPLGWEGEIRRARRVKL